MIVAVDFDGTIVAHEYPDIGAPVPGAFRWMKAWQEAGARLVLWTMRSDSTQSGPTLSEAIRFCRENGIEFWGVNHNPEQIEWTMSPKAYAQVYVDDAALGCPLRENPSAAGRPIVDWDRVGPLVLGLITGRRKRPLSRKRRPGTSRPRTRP